MIYKALVRDKFNGGRTLTISSEYDSKAQFIHDLRGNGYIVSDKKVKSEDLFDFIVEHTDMDDRAWCITESEFARIQKQNNIVGDTRTRRIELDDSFAYITTPNSVSTDDRFIKFQIAYTYKSVSDLEIDSKILKSSKLDGFTIEKGTFFYDIIPGVCVDEFDDGRICFKIREYESSKIDDCAEYLVLTDDFLFNSFLYMIDNIGEIIDYSINSSEPAYTVYSSYLELDSFIPLFEFAH